MTSGAPLPVRGARPRLPLACGVLAGLALLTALVLVCAHRLVPPIPATLTLELVFPTGRAGEREPILCTGMWREGDLLSVEFLGENRARFLYDHWGHGGPASEPVTFEPGARYPFRVSLPALTTFSKPDPGARAPLLVTLDGRDLLRAPVAFHGRLPSQLFFAENPIGASAAPVFRGQLRRPGGHLVRGGPESYFRTGERVRHWLQRHPWQAAALPLAAGAAAWLVARLVAWRLARPRPPHAPHDAARPPDLNTPETRQRAWATHRWFGGCALLLSLGYAWLVTLGTFEFNYAEVFGSFYDYQARSFLQGRLDVPEEAIGGEAFEVGGKLYGYFGPTPALFRLPFVATGVAFAKLSRAFMLAWFAASLLAAYLLLRHATRVLRAGVADRPREPSRFAVTVLVASVGAGSTLFFLGSRGLIFHEAILAGIAFALWSAWCALRHLHTPARRWWVGALVCGVLSLHARPPTGLFALALLGAVVVLLAVRDGRAALAAAGRFVLPSGLARHVAVGVLCCLALLSLNGLAYLKFGTFDPAPLRLSRPYANPARLDYIEGRSFHAANLPSNFYTYVLRPNFHLERGFPWIYLESRTPARDFPRARIDLPDRTLALPWAMPSLFLLATLGASAAFVALPAGRTALGALAFAATPMTVALLAAIATAQRYTGDFCPPLIAAAAFGLAAAECAPRPARTLCRATLALLAAAAIAVNVAITLQYQGDYLWGVPEETQRDYRLLRQRVDRFFGVPPAPDR